jgi:transcriptional regulator GlxA family with amidase domain
MQRRVVILLLEGFTDSGLSVALDVLRTANALARRAGRAEPFRTRVAGLVRGAVTAASGVVVQATATVGSVRRADIVLVPGLWVEDATSLDARLARPDVARAARALAAAHRGGAIVGSSCSAAFVLAEAGLLDGKPATTTWWLAPQLQRRRPKVEVCADQSLVAAGRVLTAGAAFAMADLALHLVTRFAGPAAARLTSRLLLLDPHPSQAAYMAMQHVSSDDPLARRAERWIRAHLARDFDVATLAREVGASARTLARHLDAALGKSPLALVQQLRVEQAVHLLETTTLSLQQVSERVGYGDATTLRRLLRRDLQTSARDLRQRGAALRVRKGRTAP